MNKTQHKKWYASLNVRTICRWKKKKLRTTTKTLNKRSFLSSWSNQVVKVQMKKDCPGRREIIHSNYRQERVYFSLPLLPNDRKLGNKRSNLPGILWTKILWWWWENQEGTFKVKGNKAWKGASKSSGQLIALSKWAEETSWKGKRKRGKLKEEIITEWQLVPRLQPFCQPSTQNRVSGAVTTRQHIYIFLWLHSFLLSSLANNNIKG